MASHSNVSVGNGRLSIPKARQRAHQRSALRAAFLLQDEQGYGEAAECDSH
jgi:hypothetical protein